MVVERILQIAAGTTWRLVPYLLLGVIVAEAMRTTRVGKVLERGCMTRPRLAIPLAAILGIASPLCTYGTVPLILQLLRAGVPLAPLATFLATSSLLNPQLLLLTWGGLGPAMAASQLAAVLVFGLLLGGAIHLVPLRFCLRSGRRETHEHHHGRHPQAFAWRTFGRDALRTLEFVGLYVVVGSLIAATIEVLVPGRWILALFGGGGWSRVLLAALLGVPLYACGGGTVPLLRSLLSQGMAGGAVLAFLIAGPATRVAPLMALATIVRPLWLLGYVVVLIAYAVAAGLVFGVMERT